MYFRYFVIISPWKRAGSFIWTNLNPIHPRMLCVKFGWNWLSGSGEEDFLISQCIFAISLLSPLGEGWGPSFEQTWIHLTQGYFVPSLVEIGSVVLEKNIFEFRQCIFTISLLSPLGGGWGPSFEQTWIHLTQGYFVPRLVDIGSVVLEENIFKFRQCIFTIS